MNKKKVNSKAALIELAVTFILCLLVVSLVAVILSSPQVRTSSDGGNVKDLLSRILQFTSVGGKARDTACINFNLTFSKCAEFSSEYEFNSEQYCSYLDSAS